MDSVFKTFILPAAILLGGCRSTKPTVSYETVSDSVAVTAESYFRLHQDSSCTSDKGRIMAEDKVSFVDDGGTILISCDGTMVISGVSGVRSARSVSSEHLHTNDSRIVKSETKDSMAIFHQSTTHGEMKPTVASGKYAWKLGIAVMLLTLPTIMIVIAKIKKKIFNLKKPRGTA